MVLKFYRGFLRRLAPDHHAGLTGKKNVCVLRTVRGIIIGKLETRQDQVPNCNENMKRGSLICCGNASEGRLWGVSNDTEALRSPVTEKVFLYQKSLKCRRSANTAASSVWGRNNSEQRFVLLVRTWLHPCSADTSDSNRSSQTSLPLRFIWVTDTRGRQQQHRLMWQHTQKISLFVFLSEGFSLFWICLLDSGQHCHKCRRAYVWWTHVSTHIIYCL